MNWQAFLACRACLAYLASLVRLSYLACPNHCQVQQIFQACVACQTVMQACLACQACVWHFRLVWLIWLV